MKLTKEVRSAIRDKMVRDLKKGWAGCPTNIYPVREDKEALRLYRKYPTTLEGCNFCYLLFTRKGKQCPCHKYKTETVQRKFWKVVGKA